MDSARDQSLDMDLVRQRFEHSRDFTLAIEEEFALVDPETLELVHRFDEMLALCRQDEVLAEAAAGELIDTEIEIRSGRAETYAEMVELQCERRRRLFALAERMEIGLVATGTHPWADYLDQHIIDTPHYRRLERDLAWVARRNQTWSLHAHVGIRGADRAIAVCDHLRGLLPILLAASANSPFLDGRDTGLHSVRSQIFTRTFPRCGVPDAFGDWAGYADFIGMLAATDSIVESTQLWWSVRPHHRFGTVEVRICDAQTSGEESFSLAGLIIACVAQAARDHDEGRLPAPQQPREVEENLWRAIRHGMDGRMIDFGSGREVETPAAVEALVEWTAPVRHELGVPVELMAPNGAQRARASLAQGRAIAEIYRDALAETERTYGPECVPG